MKMRLNKSILGIGIIILAGALVRFWGIKYGFPYSIGHFDEVFAVRYAVAFGVTKSLRPAFFYYPAFYFYLLFLLYGCFFISGLLIGAFRNVADFAFIYLTTPGVFYLIGRLCSALLGTLTVPIVYCLAKKAYGRSAGLCAALWLAFSYTHVYSSHLATPDVTMVFLACVSFLFIYNIFEQAKIKDYLLAGFFAGLAASTKYVPILLFIPLTLSHLLSTHNASPRFLKRALDKRLFCAYCMIIFGFFLGSPYWLFDAKSYMQTLAYSASHIRKFGEPWEIGTLRWAKPLYSLIKDEYVIGLCFLLGTLSAFIRTKKKDWLFLSFVLAVYFSASQCAVFRAHYILIVFPILAILAARFLLSFFSKKFDSKKTAILAGVMALIITLPSAFKIAKMDFKMSHPDSRIVAKEWIEANIPQGSKIALFTIRYREGPPIISYGGEFDSIDYGPKAKATYTNSELSSLLQDYFAQNKTYKIYRLEKKIPEQKVKMMLAEQYHDDAYLLAMYRSSWRSIAELKQKGVKYIIVPSYLYQKYFDNRPPPRAHPLRGLFLRDRQYFDSLLQSKRLTLVKEITPGAHNLGPVIKIFKITD